MSDSEQLPLFDLGPEPQTDEASATGAPVVKITPDTPLGEALTVYIDALHLGGFSEYTIKAFKSDLGLLLGWIGTEKTIGAIGTADLSRFLHWLLHERGVPCSPKSYARRVTALKNFFGYLHDMRFIGKDPSTALIQQSVGSPLPEVLTQEEIKTVLEVTLVMRHSPEKPDARPNLLVSLLLQTGIKKSECMSLRPGDVDATNPAAPILWVRYANPRMRYKERKIGLSAEWLNVLDEYMSQRQPGREIFDCTARNLEYVLRDVAQQAGVSNRKMSFEALRWTAALTDYTNGIEHEKLRQKLGLSRIAWRETSSKLAQLTKDGLDLKSADSAD
jgi:site-specific recombinase XerD